MTQYCRPHQESCDESPILDLLISFVSSLLDGGINKRCIGFSPSGRGRLSYARRVVHFRRSREARAGPARRNGPAYFMAVAI